MIQIAVLNRCTVLQDTEILEITKALQVQVDRDFTPIWGDPARLTFVKKGQKIPPGYWWLAYTDTSDDAGVLGVHDLTAQGLPVGKIFAKTDKMAGASVSATASHEVLEMILDPWLSMGFMINDLFISAEVCDPCEDSKYDYDIAGVAVSDFVYPAYFVPKAKGIYDKQKAIKKPLQVLPGGFQSVYQNGRWSQLETGRNSSSFTARKLPKIGSRRERRQRGRDNWAKSNLDV